MPSGITGTKQLAGIAQESGVTLIHHCGFDLGIKTAAMLHIVSSTPAFSLPSDTIYYAWSEHILKSPFKIEGGQLPIPDGPGLGIKVNEDQVESLRIDG